MPWRILVLLQGGACPVGGVGVLKGPGDRAKGRESVHVDMHAAHAFVNGVFVGFGSAVLPLSWLRNKKSVHKWNVLLHLACVVATGWSRV